MHLYRLPVKVLSTHTKHCSLINIFGVIEQRSLLEYHEFGLLYFTLKWYSIVSMILAYKDIYRRIVAVFAWNALKKISMYIYVYIVKISLKISIWILNYWLYYVFKFWDNCDKVLQGNRWCRRTILACLHGSSPDNAWQHNQWFISA